MTQPAMEYGRTSQNVVLGPGETLTTRTDIARGFVPRMLLLNRMAFERVSVTAIVYAGTQLKVRAMMRGQEQVYPLADVTPELADQVRRLEVTWVNRASKSTSFSFFLTDDPGTALPAAAVAAPTAMAVPPPMAGGPGPAPVMRPPGGTAPMAGVRPAGLLAPPVAIPVAASVMAPHYPATQGPELAFPRVGAQPVAAAVAAAPASELETAIAASFSVSVQSLRTIAANVGGRNGVDPQAILEFFGADGKSTVESEWLEQCKQRAVAMRLNPGELQLAQVLFGCAKTLSERQEFDQLMAEAGKGSKMPGADFTVTSATTGPDGAVHVLEHTPPPPPPPAAPVTTHSVLLELARLFEVDLEWLRIAMASIATLRELDPDALVAMLPVPTVGVLRELVTPEVEGALAEPEPDDPEEAAQWLKKDVGHYFAAAEADRPKLYNQFVATRAIDRIARAAVAAAKKEK